MSVGLDGGRAIDSASRHWDVGRWRWHGFRRSNGGLPNEAWANTEITLTRDEAGWLTLEFLAWWVRDQSRGGELIQMRPMALPPKGYEDQLGRTLKFIIDHFAICPDDLAPMLRLLQSRATDLSHSIEIYGESLGATRSRERVTGRTFRGGECQLS